MSQQAAVPSRIRDFALDIPQSQLEDLARRIDATRWPEPEVVPDWSQGTKLDVLRDLVSYWRHSYDWRRCERRLNSLGQWITEIDGLDIHFLHIRSPHPAARALLLTHGWPGSVIEFMRVIGPLSDPVAHGERAEEAFHLIIPSLPGFGFSQAPRTIGWGIERIAKCWAILMERLGYDGWFAQGGDWGSFISTQIAIDAPPGCRGIHLNLLAVYPDQGDLENPGPEGLKALTRYKTYEASGGGYSKLLSTCPQTLAYALNDSPVGLAAFILEKFQVWTDNPRSVFDVIDRDTLLDNVMLYWISGAAGTAGRLYWENPTWTHARPVAIPAGISQFGKDLFYSPRSWAQRKFTNIVHWREFECGGHFAALEQADLFVNELRTCFALMS